jgi:pimeloyl-ACP methyl ester carboxylesterase
MELQKLSVDGVCSPTFVCGPQDASEAVVYVHGNPGPKEDWQPLMQALGDGIRQVAPDFPGYGDADRPKDFDYTIAGYARHLDALLEQLKIDRVHFVGHDFGGPWLLQWASTHPERVASLTLINTGLLVGFKWHKFARIWQTPLLGELFQASATKWLLRKALNADNPRPFPDAFVDHIWSKADWGHKRAVLKLYRNSKKIGRFAAGVSQKTAALKAPTLVVWGDGDKYIPSEFADQQREHFNVEAVHHLEDCGHWPFVDEPERVSELVVPFLEKHLG